MFEDTVYRIGAQGPVPRFAFDYGRDKPSPDLISEDVDETRSRLKETKSANSTRLMCETPSFVIFRYILNNEVVYVIYSKETKKTIQFKRLESPLQPKNYVPMNFSMSESNDLYFQVMADDFLRQFPKFAETVKDNAKLKRLFKNLDEIGKLIPANITADSNPILLRCRLKKF
jgi:hypothetical protein